MGKWRVKSLCATLVRFFAGRLFSPNAIVANTLLPLTPLKLVNPPRCPAPHLERQDDLKEQFPVTTPKTSLAAN
jgi:hypothetical protein